MAPQHYSGNADRIAAVPTMPRPDGRLEVLIDADTLRARIGELAAAIRARVAKLLGETP